MSPKDSILTPLKKASEAIKQINDTLSPFLLLLDRYYNQHSQDNDHNNNNNNNNNNSMKGQQEQIKDPKFDNTNDDINTKKSAPNHNSENEIKKRKEEEEEKRKQIQEREAEERKELENLLVAQQSSNQNSNSNSNNISSNTNHENDDDENDEGSLFTFQTIEEQEEETANLRRMKRKARLLQIEEKKQQQSENDNDSSIKKQKLDHENITTMMTTTDDDDDDVKKFDATKKEDHIMHDEILKENDGNNQNSENHEDHTMKDTTTATTTKNDGMDSFDMFASSTPPPQQSKLPNNKNQKQQQKQKHLQQKQNNNDDASNYHDAEGYYKATNGEIISLHNDYYDHDDRTNERLKNHQQHVDFKVLGIVGKGVFSTVLKCTTILPNNNDKSERGEQSSALSSSNQKPIEIAMKLIRSNEVMAKAAEKEVKILRMLSSSSSKNDNNDNRHDNIVRLIELDEIQKLQSQTHNGNATTINNIKHQQRPLLEYRNHTVLLFEHLPYNLRQVLSKFGKNVGINLSSVISYTHQLISALKHLSKFGIIHADIKLDNILVTSNFTQVKLCDFGSAILISESLHEINSNPTPYLVSRFYRAPEIILGLAYDKSIDLWSVAVSIAELFTGQVFFAGVSNNDMIKRFMESIGPLSNKMIRRHIASFTKMGFVPYFELHASGGGNYDFRKQDFDKVTGKAIVRITNASNHESVVVKTKQIQQSILRSKSTNDDRGDVIKFADFLSRCLTLDPSKRISLEDALEHDLFLKK